MQVVFETNLAEPLPRAVVPQDPLHSHDFLGGPVHLGYRVPDDRQFIPIRRERIGQPAACCALKPRAGSKLQQADAPYIRGADKIK